jgi:hypothetical protein
MRSITVACCLFAAALTACGGRDDAARTDANKTAAALAGGDRPAAATNPQCTLFTPAELAPFVGAPLASGHDAAMGTGCQWEASGDASAMIQVVPARYHEPHKGAEGFKKLPDVGTRGFVEQSMGGWNAGAITGAHAVVVSVRGPAASEATAVALLRDTIKRRHE